MLNYLTLHMLQSQCESNHLIKKKKERGETDSVKQSLLSLLHFTAGILKACYPAPAALCMTKGSREERHEKCSISAAHLG